MELIEPPIPEDIISLDPSETYKGNYRLKKAGVSIPYTPEQIREIVACRDDFLYFVRRHVKIVNVDEGLVPFRYYPFQADMLNEYANNRFVIALTARQMGKCLQRDVYIKVRNKQTGEINELPIGDFYKMQRDCETR